MEERFWSENIPSIRPPGLGPPGRLSAAPTVPKGRRRRLVAPPIAPRLAILAATISLVILPSLAQQSANYKLTESVLNAAGHPADGVVLTSASHHLRLDAVGEAVVGASFASASFHADAGFTSGYPPPGQVLGLAFANRTTLLWNPEKSVGSYDLYRDVLTALSGGGYGACLQRDLASETTTDTGTPPVGSGWFYLVTAQNRLDEEGTKGTNSAGAERPNPAPCP